MFLCPCLHVNRIAYRPVAMSRIAPFCNRDVHMHGVYVHLCYVHLWDVCLVPYGICGMSVLPWANRSVRVGYSR